MSMKLKIIKFIGSLVVDWMRIATVFMALVNGIEADWGWLIFDLFQFLILTCVKHSIENYSPKKIDKDIK